MVDTQPRKLSDFEPLTAAERQVLEGLDTGEITTLGDGQVPGVDAGDDRRLRARFVRWLALGCEGSEHRLHEKGLQVRGALIAGESVGRRDHLALDLEGCEIGRDLLLYCCRFAAPPILIGARLQSLHLDDSHLPGLYADDLETRGGVILRGVVAGEVRFLGARIGGNLDCTEMRSADVKRLRNAHAKKLSADNMEARGSVFLSGAKMAGEVRLLGARIGGSLYCEGATLQNLDGPALNADRSETRGNVVFSEAKMAGEVRLLGARIVGDLDCAGATLRNVGGNALRADGAHVEGAFFLCPDDRGRHARIEGALDLTAAEIGHISDHPGSWPAGRGSLVLDRCVYGAFIGHGVSAADRRDWLELQDPSMFGQEFWPQPYEQCAKVLRKMGHVEDAREILIEKEKLQRAARRRRLRESGGRWAWLQAVWRSFWDYVLGATMRYGQWPMLAFAWLFALWLIGLMLYFGAWRADAFKPNNPFVLRSPEWALCATEAPSGIYLPSLQKIARGRGATGETQLDCFVRQPEARSFPEFCAGIYSLDVLFPLVDVAQQAHWVPDTQTWPGYAAKLYHYVQIVFGWALSLLAVAGFSGLVKSD
jgi:hypothetical protein